MKKLPLFLLSLPGLTILGLTWHGDAQTPSAPAHAHGAPQAGPTGVAKALTAGKTKRPDNAKLYIVSPKDGETVSGTFTVVFGLKGMGVAPAFVYCGDEIPTGHHHLLIDAPVPDAALPIAKDDNHKHFGNGQTEADLTLAPGTHTLQLVLGDHNHMQHDQPLISEKITITVK
ncbi:MAG: DUF4399 domain-containing protein [Verrucomicrobiales bacterium]